MNEQEANPLLVVYYECGSRCPCEGNCESTHQSCCAKCAKSYEDDGE